MGVAAALAAALLAAVASTLLAAEASRVDSLSNSAIRMFAAVPFLAAMVFVLGSEGDLASMGLNDLWQIAGSGVVRVFIGESLFAASVVALGMTRAYTTTTGVFNLLAFVLGAAFLGEAVSWRIAAGAVLILGGVYFVILYGRAGAGNPLTDLRQRLAHLPGVGHPIAAGAPAIAGPAGAVLVAAARPDAIYLPILGRFRPGLAGGALLVLLTALAWAVSVVWIRDASENFDAVSAAFVRLPLATGLLIVAAGFQPETALRRRALSRRSVAVLTVSGIFAMGLAGIVWIFALQEIGAGPASALFSTSPVFALALGALVLRERVTVWVGVGTALAVVGVVLIS